MEAIKKNLSTILNVLTLITCICGLAFGWGRINTKIEDMEARQYKIESAVICAEACQRDIFFKLGTLEGKIDALRR